MYTGYTEISIQHQKLTKKQKPYKCVEHLTPVDRSHGDEVMCGGWEGYTSEGGASRGVVWAQSPAQLHQGGYMASQHLRPTPTTLTLSTILWNMITSQGMLSNRCQHNITLRTFMKAFIKLFSKPRYVNLKQ